MDWCLAVSQKYASFEGRARRKEYWLFILLIFIFEIVVVAIDSVAKLPELIDGYGAIFTIYNLVVALPVCAISVRRLHDTNRSESWMLVFFIPIVGILIYILLMAQPGDRSANKYGRIEWQRESRTDGVLPERDE